MNYETEIMESIAMAVESAKERIPIRPDIYLAHIDYYRLKLEQNMLLIEELNSLKSTINELTECCLKLIANIKK